MLKIAFEFQNMQEAAVAIQAMIAAQNAGTVPAAQAAAQAAAQPTAQPTAPAPGPVTPVAPPAPAQAAEPTLAHVAASAPAPVPTAPPAAVPVAAAPTITREQIMTAGAALIDAGKMSELMGLLNRFGVQAVTQLKQEQMGAFATELRKLGARI